jgi:ferric-dicitrate binding protein FerR (iron transport regulator)
MQANQERLYYLFEQFTANRCSKEELQEFFLAIQQAEEEEVYPLMDARFRQLESGLAADQVDWEHVFSKVVASKERSRFAIHRQHWRWVLSAAAVVLLLVVGIYFLTTSRTGQPLAVDSKKWKQDILAPAGNKAILTLADGSKIELDSAGNGLLASQGNAIVRKLANGEIAYTQQGKQQPVQYQTVTVPRGSQAVKIRLADGSLVWINVASSITFPAAFSGNERKVKIAGEAYFEIAAKANMPFKVEANGTETEVLGTSFNINSYPDESNIKTTLLEGRIRINVSPVTHHPSSVILIPGQQAQLTPAGNIRLVQADAEEVMAWKNGKFIFNGNSIQSVMRQLEKWYDIEVTYEGQVTKEEFVGVIPRQAPVSGILAMLEKTSAVRFEIEGKKIVVK